MEGIACVTKWRGCVKTPDAIIESLSETRAIDTLTELVQRLRGTFLEIPGTRLSVAQAARLTGIELSVCRHLLESLTDSDFLKVGRDGTFTLR